MNKADKINLIVAILTLTFCAVIGWVIVHFILKFW